MSWNACSSRHHGVVPRDTAVLDNQEASDRPDFVFYTSTLVHNIFYMETKKFYLYAS
jgi:hypothetical protein